jgi:NADH:ubiquinone oxidoreductase subunit
MTSIAYNLLPWESWLPGELANPRAELATEKQRQTANRRWVIGAGITAAAAVPAIFSAEAAVTVHRTERENSETARHPIQEA